MSDNLRNFAQEFDDEPTAFANSHYSEIDNDDDDDDPVGALAYTDFTKPMPVLEGEDAERFIRIMEENERKAAERAKLPPTKKEIEKELSFCKFMLDFKERELKELREKIERLEKLNAETEEE